MPEGERGICTTEFIPFIPLNADKKYIAFYLRKKEVIEFAMNNLTGTRQPRVNIEALLSFQIPLPSLPEQKRIVARIEALFSKIDEIKRLRKEANDLAKTLLQSALHEVFSKADEKGWKWVRLGEVVSHIQSGFACSKKYETKNGIPHLRPNNIGFNGELDLSKLVHIPAEIVDLTKYSLKKGDVLFNNTNSKELVGRAALITQDLDYGFSNHITRLRVNKELITPLWMVLTVNYLWLQGYFLKICQKWIGQAGVNTKMLKSIQIPLPPLPEQKRIVARIEALFSKIDEIKRLRKEANDLAKTLLPSALHEVFSKADEKGWKWVRLGEIAFMRKQVTRPKGYPNEEFELYSIPAYHKTGYPEIRKGFEIGSSKFLVKSQDVLFGKLNPHIPKVWIVKNQTGKRQIATTEFFPIYAKNGNELLSKYLYWSLRDLRFLDSVLKLVIGTTGSRKRLQKGDFLNLEIPLPPLEEQKRIIAYLDTIQQKAQTLQKLQTETEMEIERLRESILHKAFRGEL